MQPLTLMKGSVCALPGEAFLMVCCHLFLLLLADRTIDIKHNKSTENMPAFVSKCIYYFIFSRTKKKKKNTPISGAIKHHCSNSMQNELTLFFWIKTKQVNADSPEQEGV